MIDLHTHSYISDGVSNPKEIVRLAKEAGLNAVAITDHDSIDGLKEAKAEADRLGITLVNGIEFSVKYDTNRQLHILGLGIDPENEAFLQIYNPYKKKKSESLSRVFEALQGMGLDIDREKVEPYITSSQMDRHSIAKYMVASGISSMAKYAWMDYMDKIDYFPGELIQPDKAFEAIHAAGGKAFIAHYHLSIGLKGYSLADIRRRLKELKELGLDGMEYYYPSFTTEDKKLCESLIKELGFIKSGGSDFHGSNRAGTYVGVGEGDLRVPDELLENIIGR